MKKCIQLSFMTVLVAMLYYSCTTEPVEPFKEGLHLPFEMRFNSGWEDWEVLTISGSSDWETTKESSEPWTDDMVATIVGADNEITDSWLISPAIEMSEGPTKLKFKSRTLTADSESAVMQFLISEDYNGDPEKATWEEIQVSWDVQTDVGPIWIETGYTKTLDIIMSEFTGVYHFAFHYSSDGLGSGEKWNIDNFTIHEGLPAQLTLSTDVIDFGSLNQSDDVVTKTYIINTVDITEPVSIGILNPQMRNEIPFKISADNVTFDWNIKVPVEAFENGQAEIYVRFNPADINGEYNMVLLHESEELEIQSVDINGSSN